MIGSPLSPDRINFALKGPELEAVQALILQLQRVVVMVERKAEPLLPMKN